MEDLKQLLIVIEDELLRTAHFTGVSGLTAAQREAFLSVPREKFVSVRQSREAFENYPLPISCGQTISQPYIVALMTALLQPTPDSRILEIGTGSGYQAALLSKLAKTVYTLEIFPELKSRAETVLQTLGLDNVKVTEKNGFNGLPEAAPFDGIIVTCASEKIPEPLWEQLKPGGRMVIPLGPAGGDQNLAVAEKGKDGKMSLKHCLPVAFVPMLSGKKT